MATKKKDSTQKKPWAGYPVAIEVQVRWRDLDAYSHVTNSVYFNYFEEARIALFQKVPIFRNARKKESKYGSTLVKTEAEYKSQAFLGQTLVIAAWYSAVRKIFIDTEYKIFEKESMKLVAKGKASNILIEKATFTPVSVPADVEKEIAAFML